MNTKTLILFLIVLVLAVGCTVNTEIDKEVSSQNTVELGEESKAVESSSNALEEVEVLVIGYNFEPKTVTVKAGSTVTWINKDSMEHTVTSDTGNELDSKLFSKGEVYTHTFEKAGEYAYHCTPHPMMMGKVIVE